MHIPLNMYFPASRPALRLTRASPIAISLHRNFPAIGEARVRRKAGPGLSQDARKEQDLALTPAQEKLIARQVIVVLMGNCADRTLCGVMHSPTLGCDRLDAANGLWNPVYCQRRKADNIARNLLRVANNSEIATTSKMTIGMSACTVMCECINVVSTDHHWA